MHFEMGDMIFIFLLALVIFGPKKLPEIARQVGKALAEFKRASNEFKSQLEQEIQQIEVAEQAKKLAAAQAAEPVIAPPSEAIPQSSLPAETNKLASPPDTAVASDSNGNTPELASSSLPVSQEFNG